MKKLLRLVLVCVLVLSFFALSGCGGLDSGRLEKIEQDMQKTQEELARLEQELLEAKARILLLEGKVEGDKDKIYGLGDTVTFSSGGLKLFSITVDEAFLVETSLIVHFTYKNLGYPVLCTMDQLFDARKSTGGTNGNRHGDVSIHKIKIGETYSSKNDTKLSPLGNPLAFSYDSVGVQQIIFGLYNFKQNDNDRQIFIPFAVFELNFQLQA